MKGHVRDGRRYLPELAAKVELTSNDWFRDDMPDYLWPTLLAGLEGDDALVRFARWQRAVQADLSGLVSAKELAAGLDGRLTSLDRLKLNCDSAAASIRTRAREFDLLPDQVVNALATYPHRPASWLIEKDLTEPEQPDIDLLKDALIGALDGHREALIKCLQIWSAVQAGHYTTDQDSIDLLKNYPNDKDNLARADTVVRSSWGAMKGLATYEDPDRYTESVNWAMVFWGINSMTTGCVRKRQSESESEEKDEEGTSGGPTPTSLSDIDEGSDYRRIAMDLMSSYVEALETAPQRLYDQERQEVHAGLVSRAARQVITALGAPDLWSLEHGSHVGRTLIETRIQLTWMAEQDPSIYRSYQEYGAGKAKLYARIMESLPDEWFGSNEELKDAVAEGVAEFDRLSHTQPVLDTRIVDTRSTFAGGKTLREMASDVGLENLYRNSFQLQSGIVHGEWWAVESHSMERCLNVLHRAHLIPSLSLGLGGNTAIAESWLGGLHTLIRLSLSVLGTQREAVDAAFDWLNNGDEGEPPEPAEPSA